MFKSGIARSGNTLWRGTRLDMPKSQQGGPVPGYECPMTSSLYYGVWNQDVCVGRNTGEHLKRLGFFTLSQNFVTSFPRLSTFQLRLFQYAIV